MITFRSLYDSPIVRVREYICRACRGGPEGEEHTATNTLVLMRHGAFCKHFGKRSFTADVNQSVFFSKNSTYRVSHPADCGDRGTIFEPSLRILQDIVRELDPSVDDHPDQPFPFITGPCETSIFWRHRELVQQLEMGNLDTLEPFWADVTALQLIADVLEAAFVRKGVPRKRRRADTETDHVDRVDAVKSLLGSRLHERLMLDDIAKEVHLSPFHLARIFQQHTGTPIHRYLTQLRLRASLERLANGENDLTILALDLGFSSHSHFADLFRREFGCTPSDARKKKGLNS